MLLKIITYLLSFGALLGLVFIILTAIGWDKVWTWAAGPADLGAVEFDDLKKRRTPNQALICPENMCRDEDRDLASPVYELTAEQLRERLLVSLQKEERLERVDDKSDPTRLRFVQRTKLMKYPDTVNIKLIDFGEGRSTLALYSRSKLGSSDLGVNLQRAKRWLKRLSEFEAG